MPSLKEHLEAQLVELENVLTNDEAFKRHCEKHREKIKITVQTIKRTLEDLKEMQQNPKEL